MFPVDCNLEKNKRIRLDFKKWTLHANMLLTNINIVIFIVSCMLSKKLCLSLHCRKNRKAINPNSLSIYNFIVETYHYYNDMSQHKFTQLKKIFIFM